MLRSVMNNKPLVSVIVPIFNVEAYLDECLFSIRNQTYTKLEIICVNDGSDDHSGDIAQRHRDQDARIIYFAKSNGGLSSARNVGLSKKNGEYVIFVDSDDVLKDFAIQEMLNAITVADADILVFGAELFPFDSSSEHEQVVSRYLSPRNRIYRGNNVFEYALFNEESCNIFVWNKMYKSQLFRSGVLFDEEIQLGEDRCFLFDIFPKTKILQLVDVKPYRYRQKRGNSLTGSYQSKQYERVIWKLKLLDHIFLKWFSDSGITQIAKENLINWSTNYIIRSVKGLSDEASAEIVAGFNTILKNAKYRSIDIVEKNIKK